ncbi:hypothetical protein [Trueperella pyogenes]|uniref:hypothetical protein n=1 Tax=Trueperella pyogenes TaxID=1661 RepID=UPI00043AC5B7|nr:hypothetical protein [Trueperella pyogenes]AHU90511.1 hypothetical protein CQ11_06050 [Trueperella pyogenes]AWA43602.1 hypothetical protein DBV13_06020 [Trueperella pyogenes]AZR02307.1 hypothetical protein EB775_02640 [Trueperella pyogenes]
MGKDSRFVAFAKHFEDQLGAYLSGIGALFLAVGPFFKPVSFLLTGIFMGLGFVAVIASAIRSNKRIKEADSRAAGALERLKEREKEIVQHLETSKQAKSAILSSIEQIVSSLSKQLNLYNGAIRTTVYAFERSENALVPLARVSQNPSFASINRPKYPATNGHLGKAWNEGILYETNRREATLKSQALELGYSEQEYDSLVLKPRSLFARHLCAGRHNSPIGVILWESPDPHAIKWIDEFETVDSLSTFKDLESVLEASLHLYSDLSSHALGAVTAGDSHSTLHGLAFS